MDISNLINLGILGVTALVGILTWVATRKSAREARQAQETANLAAVRSADAAEKAAQLQSKMLDIESQRHQEAAIEAQRAKLQAERTRREVRVFDRPDHEWYLTIRNTGSATARNVAVVVDGQPMKSYDEFIGGFPDGASVGPGGHIDIMYILHSVGRLRVPFHLELMWDDDSPIRGEWSGTV